MTPHEARTVEELVDAIAEHGEPKWVHFWGHRPNKDGSTGAGCFSQWWPCSFVVDGVTYRSAEHWMMAEKARLFDDDESREKIIACKTPGEAKKLGRLVTPFDDAKWKAACFEIVVGGNVAKFSQNADCLSVMRQTGTKVLVEAAPRDRIWGIGMGAANENARRPELWRGQNQLGFALMEVRDRLTLTP